MFCFIVVLICISLMNINVEYLFLCFWPLYNFLGEMWNSDPFPIFILGYLSIYYWIAIIISKNYEIYHVRIMSYLFQYNSLSKFYLKMLSPILHVIFALSWWCSLRHKIFSYFECNLSVSFLSLMLWHRIWQGFV